MSRSPRHRSHSYSRSRSRSPGGYREGGGDDGNCTVFAGNLNHDTNENGLREFFASWGTVLDTKIIYDQETGRSRGFGFVKFDDQRDAEDAINEADGKVLDGRPLKCNPARSGGGRGGFHPRGGFRGGFRGGPPGRGRGGGRFGYGDYNNYGNPNFFGGRGGYGSQSGPPHPHRHRRRSYSQSPGRYSPGRYSPGSRSRSASPPAKRVRRSHHHREKPHAAAREEPAAPRPAPPTSAPPNGQAGAAPPEAGPRKPPRRRGASPSGSSSFTSGSSYSTTDSEASPRRNPPQIRAPPAAAPPAAGSFRKELHAAKQRESEQSMRAAALEAEVEQARTVKQEAEAKLEEVHKKLQKSEEHCKQYRKWLVALAEHSKAAINGKEAIRATQAEIGQREDELGLFLKEADSFLATVRHRSGRRKRERQATIEADAAATRPESDALEGVAQEAGAEIIEAETGDAAAKFKPGIKFKLAS